MGDDCMEPPNPGTDTAHAGPAASPAPAEDGIRFPRGGRPRHSACVVAGAAFHDVAWTDRYVVASVLAMLIFDLLGRSSRLYHPWRGASPHQYLWPVLVAWVWTVLGLFVLAWITKSTAHYSRVAIGLWAVFGLLGLIGWRVAGRAFLSAMRTSGRDARRIVIAGTGDHARRLAHVVRSVPALRPGPDRLLRRPGGR